VGPARWKAWLKLGLYIAVGAPPLATPFTVDELTIVAWLKNDNKMRVSDKWPAAPISAAPPPLPPPPPSLRPVKDVCPFDGAPGEFL